MARNMYDEIMEIQKQAREEELKKEKAQEKILENAQEKAQENVQDAKNDENLSNQFEETVENLSDVEDTQEEINTGYEDETIETENVDTVPEEPTSEEQLEEQHISETFSSIKKQIDDIVNIENKTVEEIKEESVEVIVPIDVEKLVLDYDQPFSMYSEEEKERMKQSIKVNGIINPIIVKPIEDGKYLVLSGRNRVTCAKELGITKVNCIVKNVDDDIAKLIMVETNIVKREEMSTMTKAKAYKIQLDVYKKKNIDIRQKNEKVKEEDLVANKVKKTTNLSYRQLAKLVSLTKLTDEFQTDVDNGLVSIDLGSAISGLSKNSQKRLYHIMKDKKIKPTEKQITELAKYEGDNGVNSLTPEVIENKLTKETSKNVTVSINFSEDDMLKFFGMVLTKEAIKENILELLNANSNTTEETDLTGSDE